MKKIFFSILATLLISTVSVYAEGGKPAAKKQAVKKECSSANCPDKANCPKPICKPGCVCH